MSQTQRFRDQHQAAVGLVHQISGLLDANALAHDAHRASQLLSELAGALMMHLAMEDNALYPRMIASADPKVSVTAKRFQSEMGGIKGAFTAYMDKWGTSNAIQRDAGAFVTETKGLFQALGARIDKENTELYPLADKM